MLLPTGRARRARAKDLRPRGRDAPRPEARAHRHGERGSRSTALGGRPGRSGRRGGGRGGPGSPVAGTVPTAGRPEPASLARSPAAMLADQRLPRVPAEPGTIPRLCALLLGAQETKRKCQEHVNQTRYSVTITSLSGLPAPTPRAHRPDTCPGDRPAPDAKPGRTALRAAAAPPGPVSVTERCALNLSSSERDPRDPWPQGLAEDPCFSVVQLKCTLVKHGIRMNGKMNIPFQRVFGVEFLFLKKKKTTLKSTLQFFLSNAEYLVIIPRRV